MSNLNINTLLGMRANAGEILAPEAVIGRNELIRSFWEILEQQSLVISAERRMGKTSILKKMEAEPKPNQIAIYQDLAGVETPLLY